eukprot:s4548_g3.t1
MRAMQGHNKAVMEHAKLSSIVKKVFTLDPTFTVKDLDSNKIPLTNLRPDLCPELLKELPRILYHSCDRTAMEKIIEHGLIPVGWPRKTPRAQNHFITTHPWDVGARKLAGTRAGKQYYIAFDIELVVQGRRIESAGSDRESFVERQEVEGYLENNEIRPGEMATIDNPSKLPTLQRRREGKDGFIIDNIDLKSCYFRALSFAQTIRGHGKGKGSRPGGKAGGTGKSRNAENYLCNRKTEQKPVACHSCNASNAEGTRKCQGCFKWLVGWTDGRIATEVCRLERTAKTTNGIFFLDKIDSIEFVLTDAALGGATLAT